MDNKAERLMEIKEEMLELLDEARMLVRGTHEEDRAGAYWLAHIRMALDNEHNYLGRGGCTMQSTIEALEDDQDEGVDDSEENEEETDNE